MPYKGLTFAGAKNMKPIEIDRLLAIFLNSTVTGTDYEAVARDLGSNSINSIKTMVSASLKKYRTAQDGDDGVTPTQTPKKGGRKRHVDLEDDPENAVATPKQTKKVKNEAKGDSDDDRTPEGSPLKYSSVKDELSDGASPMTPPVKAKKLLKSPTKTAGASKDKSALVKAEPKS